MIMTSRVPTIHIYILFFLTVLGSASCQKSIMSEQKTSSKPNYKVEVSKAKIDESKIDGMTLVAPPSQFKQDPMPALRAVNVEWIAVVPYAYTRLGDPNVHFGQSTQQWWGETPDGAVETIKLGQKSELGIMLKPQVYVPGSWTGGIDYENEADWQAWEAAYEKYIMTFAEIAAAQDVPLLCIGTEFKVSTIERPDYWIGLIEKIKSVYKGKLTYAANWDEYPHITWWDKVDYIGVDAYFPLSTEAIPKVSDLVQAWQPYAKEMKMHSKKFNTPILFTEFGYMSVEGCAGKTWELEKNRSVLIYNEQAQANAFEALHQVFYPQNYWAGGFIWKWYPNEFAGRGRMSKDYTPQNKLGQTVLSNWYLTD